MQYRYSSAITNVTHFVPLTSDFDLDQQSALSRIFVPHIYLPQVHVIKVTCPKKGSNGRNDGRTDRYYYVSNAKALTMDKHISYWKRCTHSEWLLICISFYDIFIQKKTNVRKTSKRKRNTRHVHTPTSHATHMPPTPRHTIARAFLFEDTHVRNPTRYANIAPPTPDPVVRSVKAIDCDLPLK